MKLNKVRNASFQATMAGAYIYVQILITCIACYKIHALPDSGPSQALDGIGLSLNYRPGTHIPVVKDLTPGKVAERCGLIKVGENSFFKDLKLLHSQTIFVAQATHSVLSVPNRQSQNPWPNSAKCCWVPWGLQ